MAFGLGNHYLDINQTNAASFNSIPSLALSNRRDDLSGDILLLGPHHDLARHARLAGVGHPDVGHNLAARDGLAEQFERVRRGVYGYVCAL